MKKITAFILALVMVLCLTACGTQTNTDNGDDTRGAFVFGGQIGNVDPASGAYAWVGMRSGVMESLFRFDDSMNVQKNLVDDYSVSDDGLVWTIVLRDGVLFQSGNIMDAAAVKASLERTCSMQSRAEKELNIASIGRH